MIAQNHYHHHHQPASQQLLHQLSLWLGLAAAVRIKQSFCLCFIICSGLQVTVVNLPQVTTLQHQLHQQLKIKAQLVLQVFLLGPEHGKYPPMAGRHWLQGSWRWVPHLSSSCLLHFLAPSSSLDSALTPWRDPEVEKYFVSRKQFHIQSSPAPNVSRF